MWFDPGLAGLFITSTLLHLGEDINLLIMSDTIKFELILKMCLKQHFELTMVIMNSLSCLLDSLMLQQLSKV